MDTVGLGNLIESYLFWRSPLARIKHSRERVAHERKTFFDMLNAMQISLRAEDHAGSYDPNAIVERPSAIPKAPSDTELWEAEQQDSSLGVRVI